MVRPKLCYYKFNGETRIGSTVDCTIWATRRILLPDNASQVFVVCLFAAQKSASYSYQLSIVKYDSYQREDIIF